MRKTDSLRAAITAAIPEIATEPSRLIMWIDQGGAKGTLTDDESFEMKYRLNITLLDMTTDIALLMLTVQHWCRVNQPQSARPARDSAHLCRRYFGQQSGGFDRAN